MARKASAVLTARILTVTTAREFKTQIGANFHQGQAEQVGAGVTAVAIAAAPDEVGRAVLDQGTGPGREKVFPVGRELGELPSMSEAHYPVLDFLPVGSQGDPPLAFPPSAATALSLRWPGGCEDP